MAALLKKLCAILTDILGLLKRLCSSAPDRSGYQCPDQACFPALKKPDPFIYDQYYLMSLGYPVTWDNPDVFIYSGSTLVDPHGLQASTAYTVAARIWNDSADVPVIDMPVAFSYLSFGMGTQSHPIGTTTTDLGVKGLAGCPAFAYMDWTTPATLGHYCLQVLLEPPDDLNWQNNLGQRNTDVTQPASPAAFTFTVQNPDDRRTAIVTFSVDTYAIPPLPACDDRGSDASRLAAISKTAPPVPDGWSVVLTPSELQLAPGGEQTVEAAITPPAGFAGTMPFNVTARNEVRPIGGVTLYVEVP